MQTIATATSTLSTSTSLLSSMPTWAQEFFEFSNSPLSLVLAIIVSILLILLVLAMFIPSIKRGLVKSYILEKDESPQSFLVWIVSVVFIVRILQVFVMQPFIVDGESMLPTFVNNDMLIIDKLSYKIREPERGDVVVFRFHKDGNQLDGKYFIKRLIGLPGDTIEIVGASTTVKTTDGRTLKLDESFIKYPKFDQDLNVILKNDEYFVEGDNRAGSYDSRAWGAIHKSQLSGRVFLELFDSPSILPGKVNFN